MIKIKFHIQPTALIFFLWTLFVNEGNIGIITLLAAFFHECGHILAAKRMHIPLRSLRLDLLGARLEASGRMLSYTEEWLLCAAGPLVSLTLSAAAAPLWRFSSSTIAFSCVSLLLGCLNLLPIRTFDGGRMMECWLCSFLSVRIAGNIMRIISFVFLFLLWATSVYFLLRVGDGLSLLLFSMSLFFRFFSLESEVCHL